MFISTTAGFTGETRCWRVCISAGIAGERLDPDLELYRHGRGGHVLVAHPAPTVAARGGGRALLPGAGAGAASQHVRATAREQVGRRPSRRSLPARCGTAAWIRPCARSRPPIEPVWVGLDVAMKNDGTGVCGCPVAGRRTPAARVPPDLACPVDLAAVERYLLSVHERFPIHVVVDPFQALRTRGDPAGRGSPDRGNAADGERDDGNGRGALRTPDAPATAVVSSLGPPDTGTGDNSYRTRARDADCEGRRIEKDRRDQRPRNGRVWPL